MTMSLIFAFFSQNEGLSHSSMKRQKELAFVTEKPVSGFDAIYGFKDLYIFLFIHSVHC